MNDPFDRAVMRERLDARQRRTRHVRAGLRWHAQVYVAVNLLIVVIYVLTEQGSRDHESPWWVWSVAGWGVGLFLHWYHYRRHVRSDARFEARLVGGGGDLNGSLDGSVGGSPA